MGRSLHIQTYPLGEWQTNCYVLWTEGDEACWIVDAGYDPRPLIEGIRARRLEPQRLLLTHAHLDHIGGIADLRAAWPQLPITIHPAERAFLTDPDLNLSSFIGMPLICPPADDIYEHGDRLTLGGLSFEVRATPGHSPGGVTLYQPDEAVALVGDTLFYDSIGRYDFPTSDPAALLRSLQEQLMTLPDDTRVYPGHGPATTIERERRMNPYVRMRRLP